MSMLTPLGKGGRQTVRRGDRPSRRGALLLAVLLTAALAGTAWWVSHRDTADSAAADSPAYLPGTEHAAARRRTDGGEGERLQRHRQARASRAGWPPS